ncbi:MAG: ATP-dependent DNA helicase [Oscillospiraceae bacterium]|jgi:Rad3-related DNA helicase|nr:ATP-dependent DNA helicase [Oscillospiraceae bacterium]
MIHKKLSVRNLVEFILRSGSIDSRASASVKLAEGARLHRLLQKLGGDGYETEVYLTITAESGGVEFTVSGRADGVITAKDGEVTIDEIKTTMKSVALISEDDYPVHWAQAMCYGHIYCAQNSREALSVRLTYYQADSGELNRFTRAYTAAELRGFFENLLEKYVPWAILEHEWRETSRASMKTLPFPFETYRDGQRRLSGAVYRAISDGFRLYAMAPTGIGKTVSTLFPALKAMGEGLTEKIFYLTAKTVTRAVAVDAVTRMQSGGLRVKTVVISAKDKTCVLDERVCTPERCPRADGHFDRVNDAMLDILQNEDLLTPEVVARCAEKRRVCPFELSLDLSLWADVVVCDYNYAFDPRVYLKRFFADGGGEYVFLVDEAHNLADRAREMFSASVDKRSFSAAKRPVAKRWKKLRAALTKINAKLLEYRDAGSRVSEARPPELDRLLDTFIVEMGDYLAENADTPQETLDAYFAALAYRQISELYADAHRTLTTVAGGSVTVKLFCADPSALLSEALTRARAAVLFSATLTPIGYFAAVLGGDEASSKTLILPSPFPRENLLPLAAVGVSTRYRDRERSVEPVAELIYRAAQGRAGNYIAYFPSYKYMDGVYAAFLEKYPAAASVRQESGMDDAARERFLARFTAENAPLVGFCVLGGAFSEGIDLTGDKLIGAIIVGVGLPQINVETDIVRAYYDARNGAGYDFAYKFPGMNKVLQAAGRVIRSERDRGVVLLIDDRFAQPQYAALFPAHWAHRRFIGSSEDLPAALARFWGD